MRGPIDSVEVMSDDGDSLLRIHSSDYGDMWIKTNGANPVRFRTQIGGGHHPEVLAALKNLYQAIQNNQE